MDPRERADAALARARARGSFVVTPDDAVSPMDAASTLQIPRIMVSALEEEQPTESTRLRKEGTITGMTPPPMQAQQPVRPQYGHGAPTQPFPVPNTQSNTAPLPVSGQTQPVQPQEQPPAVIEEQPSQRTVDGLVPTVTQTGTQRSLLSRRLEGE